jgi:secreted trypsin-like serine protease
MSNVTDCQYIDGEDVCAHPIRDIKVKKVISHESFSYSEVKNDIALIQLAEIAPSNQNNINPICLPFFAKENPKKMIVSGFGRTETSGGMNSDVLLKVAVNLRDNDDCKKTKMNKIIQTDDTQICAGGGFEVEEFTIFNNF